MEMSHQSPSLDFIINNDELPLVVKCDYLTNYISSMYIDEMSNKKTKNFFSSLPLILSNLYESPIENKNDYLAIYNLFTLDFSRSNLSSIIIVSCSSSLNYILDISSISSYFTRQDYLLSNKIALFKQLLNDYLIINDSSNHLYNNNQCIMPLFEYFIVVFLISAKKVEYTNRKYLNVYTKDHQKTFSEYFKWNCSVYNKNESTNGQQTNETLNLNRSFQYNFYRNIFAEYLNFFYNEGMNSKLLFIFKAIDICWLYDYLIDDNLSSTLLKTKTETTPFQFVKANKIKTSYTFFSSLSPSKKINAKYPNLLIIDCLSLFINFTYEKLQVEHLFPLRKTLLCFLEFAFENKTTYYLTDVYISDVISLWLSYALPWNITNSHSKINQNKSFIKQFININIPFYIVILDKCIQAFSLYKNNANDYIQLSKSLLLFSIEKKNESNKSFVMDYLPFDKMRGYSLEDYKSFLGYEIIEKKLAYYGRSDINIKQIMIPFAFNSQGRQAANSIILNNTLLIEKLSSKDNNNTFKTVEKTKKFIDTLNQSNDIIKQLYQISNNGSPVIQTTNFIKYNCNERQLYLQRIIFPDKNPWNMPKHEDEISFLYIILKFISQIIDRLRGIKQIDDNSSSNQITQSVALTNLRPLCNVFNLLNFFALLIILFSLCYTIYYSSILIKLNKA